MSDKAPVPDLGSWDGQIEHYDREGLARDEIVAEFDRELQLTRHKSMYAWTRGGDHLDWGSLRDRRLVELLLDALLTAKGRRRPGRPKMTEEQVTGELEAALANLAEKGVARPATWAQVAAAHEIDGLAMSPEALRKRRRKFPTVYSARLPHLHE